MITEPVVRIVWDGQILTVPPEMGSPADDQLIGTPHENLIELAGRVCYDSLGKGRSSEAFHDHIQEVNHTSIYEHVVLSFGVSPFDAVFSSMRLMTSGRKGVEVRYREPFILNVTINARAAYEWLRYNPFGNLDYNRDQFGLWIWRQFQIKMPNVFTEKKMDQLFENKRFFDMEIAFNKFLTDAEFKESTPPLTSEDNWISLYIGGISRGLSHELVRHRYAVSQRSTRYCDESESEWIPHPAILNNEQLLEVFEASQITQATRYSEFVRELEKSGCTRKVARGAARGLLGNALSTELIFSAPLSGWKDMIRQRNNPAADAEIWRLFAKIERVLQPYL